MSLPTGYLAAHPLPPGITGALGLQGYQLLADVGGVGAGRLGAEAFLLAVDDPAGGSSAPGAGPAGAGTQISLHQGRLRDEAEAAAYVQLAAQLGLLRLSGYRVALEREGLRSRFSLVDPGTGAIALALPTRPGGRLFGGGTTAGTLLAAARGLAPAGAPPDLGRPELLRDTLLALALADDSLGGAAAAETADRALALIQARPGLDPARALEVAKTADA
ncbi:MAG TPA: hypothetical protein VFN48_06840 [Solirubrobacteraceae bacterium]|nr:hypothetical protein [Solirubrobacteraceae bacterium]